MPEPEVARWLNGRPTTLASLRGKVILLGLWSGYSGDKHKIFAQLAEIERQHRGRGLAVMVVVCPPWDETYVRKLLLEAKADYPVGLVRAQPRSGSLPRFVSAVGPASYYVIDRNGFTKPSSQSSGVEAEIEQALGKQAPER